jgi:hypothetical protein
LDGILPRLTLHEESMDGQLSHRELWKTADIDTLRKEIALLRKKEAAYAALVKELQAALIAAQRIQDNP